MDEVFYDKNVDTCICVLSLLLIENNELTGSIPPELENLKKLDSLSVGE